MPSDRLESMLDDLKADAPAPPPEFLGQVRKRRRRLRAVQAAYAAGLALAAAALTTLFVRPVPEPRGTLRADAELSDESIFVLNVTNSRSPGVVLPESPAGAPDEVLKAGQRLDPDDLTAWVSGS